MPLNPAHQSAQTVERGRALVVTQAHEARDHQRRHQRIRQRLNTLEADYPALTHHDFHSSVSYWILVICMAGAFLLDRYLFAPVIDEVAAGSVEPSAMPVARLLIPALLVLTEMSIGIMRYRAEDRIYGTRRLAATGWSVLGVVLALVMPLLVSASQIAAYLGEPNPTTPDLILLVCKTVGLVALSLALHLFLVFGDTHDAKAYVAARFTHRRLIRNANRTEETHARAVRDARDTFARYERARQDHNTAHGHLHREQGPFDSETVTVINGESSRPPGAVVQSTPSVVNVPPAPSTPPPSAPPPDPGLHGNESEVTPN